MSKFQGKYRIEPNRCKYWDYSSPGFYFVTVCITNRKCILGSIHQGKMQLSEYGKIVENEILKIPEYNSRAQLDEWIIMPNHIHLLIELTNEKTGNGVNADCADNGDDGDGDGNGDDDGDGDGDGDGNTDGDGDADDDGDGDGDGNTDDDGDVEKIHEFSLPPPPQPPHHPNQPHHPRRPSPQPTSRYTSNQPWWQNHDYKPTIDEIKQYRKYRRKMIIPKIMGKLQMQTSKQINKLRNTPGNKNWQSNYHDHFVRDNASYQCIKHYIINNPKNWDEDKLLP